MILIRAASVASHVYGQRLFFSSHSMKRRLVLDIAFYHQDGLVGTCTYGSAVQHLDFGPFIFETWYNVSQPNFNSLIAEHTRSNPLLFLSRHSFRIPVLPNYQIQACG